MLTSKDIQKLVSVLATKNEVREMKDELQSLRGVVHDLVTAVDKLTGAIDNLRIEYVAIKIQLDRHEQWIKQLAEKMHIKLKT